MMTRPSYVTDSEVDLACRILDMRRLREVDFPSGFFDEFGWEMILMLFVANANGKQIDSAELIKDVGSSDDSGIRWLRTLEGSGQITRVSGDTFELTPRALRAISHFLDRSCHLLGLRNDVSTT